VWQSSGHNGPLDEDGYEVFGRRYDAQGEAAGPELHVNTASGNTQGGASVAGLGGGRFIVVWGSAHPNGFQWDVKGQFFAADGSKEAAEFQVNSYSTKNQWGALVAAHDDGRFFVVWTSSGQDGDCDGIFAQRYKTDGATVEGEFQINSFAPGCQTEPSAATFGDGGSVVVWAGPGPNSDSGIFARRYHSNGLENGDQFQINSPYASDPARPSVATFADARFVVTWEATEPGGMGWGIRGQLFASDGSKDGAELTVNSLIEGMQGSSTHSGRRVAAFSDGRFVVVWSGMGKGDDAGIFLQRFAGDGTQQGNDDMVNTCKAFGQWEPAVAVSPDDGFIIVWSSTTQDGELGGIFTQRYGPTGTKVYH